MSLLMVLKLHDVVIYSSPATRIVGVKVRSEVDRSTKIIPPFRTKTFLFEYLVFYSHSRFLECCSPIGLTSLYILI